VYRFRWKVDCVRKVELVSLSSVSLMVGVVEGILISVELGKGGLR
jgi:hypothetical protein